MSWKNVCMAKIVNFYEKEFKLKITKVPVSRWDHVATFAIVQLFKNKLKQTMELWHENVFWHDQESRG